MTIINVAKDFTRFPSGRYKRNGQTSGEAFRERFLQEPLSRGGHVVVQLDGTIGYGSSFLEEAFGGVVRSLKLSADFVLNHLTLESDDQELLGEIREYIIDAGRRLQQ